MKGHNINVLLLKHLIRHYWIVATKTKTHADYKLSKKQNQIFFTELDQHLKFTLEHEIMTTPIAVNIKPKKKKPNSFINFISRCGPFENLKFRLTCSL